MRVAHVIDSLGVGGAERMLVDLANETAFAGHQVSVCVTRGDVRLADQLAPSIEVLVLDRKTRFAIGPSLRFVRWLAARKPDVLHVHMRSSLQYMLALRAVHAISAPIVFHDHYGRIEADSYVPWWFRVGHRGIAQYVGVHDALRDWARSAGMPAIRTRTLANAIALRRITSATRHDLRAELRLDTGVGLAVLVASFKPEKGIDDAIRAIAELPRPRRWHLVVAGAGESSEVGRACRALVRSLGVENDVSFLGVRDDVPALLHAADAGLVSSYSESGPLVLLEYIAAGLPIVSTRVGNIGHRLAEKGVPGFVPPRDVHAFTHALVSVGELSAGARRERIDIGRAALAEWDLASTMVRWYDVYADAQRSAS